MRMAGHRAARLLALTGALLLLLAAGTAAAHNSGWKSGVMRTAVAEPQAFASWRGTSLGVAIGWIQWRDEFDLLSSSRSERPFCVSAEANGIMLFSRSRSRRSGSSPMASRMAMRKSRRLMSRVGETVTSARW